MVNRTGTENNPLIILYNALKENQTQRWIENHLDHPFTVSKGKFSLEIPAPEEESEDG